jgi:SM-20-related protein
MTDNEKPAVIFDKLPPYFIKENFFGLELVNQLLEHVLENRSQFVSSTVGSDKGRIDQEIRISSILHDFGLLKKEIKERFNAVFPEALEQLRMPSFELYGTEREIVAHGNGAFYKRHIDTFTGAGEFSVRALTAVYYFHAQPKKFQGGDLRLLPLRNNEVDSTYLDIEPKNDRLLLFPSWVPHSVMPVISDSTDFRDSRFAINCWYHKLKS